MAKKTYLLIGFVLLKFLLQYWLISPEYELHRDEYLHLDHANHLAWGYLSVPPLTAWVSYMIAILGNGEFWVRFFPALFGALTIVVVWKAIEELRGNLFALVLGATGVLFSVLLRLNILYQPNSLDVLCWTTCYLILIKYINTENRKWLFIAGAVLAIGFLNKYSILFLLVGIFPALLITKQRVLFTKKELYLAVLLGLLLVMPNLLWQYQNGFPVFWHFRELADTQLVHVDRFAFMRSQLLFFGGSLFVIVSALYAFWFYEPFQKYRFFFWAFVFTLLFFIWVKAKDYYAIALYPIYIAFGAVFLANLFKAGWKRYLQPIAVAIPVLFFIPAYNWVFPNKSPKYIVNHGERYKELGMLRWEDGKDHALPQDFADMLGWKELARKVDQVYATIPHPDRTLVLCDNYGQAGAINYYTSKGIRAVSFNADYINWFDFDRPYTNLIRVKSYGERENELQETSPFFDYAVIADSVTNQYARERGTTIFVFVGTRVDVNSRLKKEIAQRKNGR